MFIEKQDIQEVPNATMNMLREEELELVNALHDALKAKDIETTDEVFTKFLAEIETNFQTEESMMEQAGYSDAQMHTNDHNAIRKKLEKFKKRWDVLKGPTELLGFLEKDFKKWYIQHIAKWDTQAAPQLV